MTDPITLSPEQIARQASAKTDRLKAEHRQALRLLRAKHAEIVAQAKWNRMSAVDLTKLKTAHVDALTTLQVTQADEMADAITARQETWNAFQESQRGQRDVRLAARRAGAKPVGRPRKDGLPAGSVKEEYPQVTDEFWQGIRAKYVKSLTPPERHQRLIDQALIPRYWAAIEAATGLALPEKVGDRYAEMEDYRDRISNVPVDVLRSIVGEDY